MRATLLLVLLTLALPGARADGAADCPEERVEAPDVEISRSCHGIELSAQDPNGRTHGAWTNDSISLFREPRFLFWGEGPFGCEIIVFVAGAVTTPCPAAPPAPPSLP